MKRDLFLLKPFLIALFALCMYAEANEIEDYKKIYFKLDQLQIENEKMSIILDDEIISIENISKDQRGYHTYKSAKIVGAWTCPACWNLNSMFDHSCSFCGWPK